MVSSHSISNGAIGGIVVGIAAAALAGIAGFVYYRFKIRSSEPTTNPQGMLEEVHTESSMKVRDTAETDGQKSGLVYPNYP